MRNPMVNKTKPDWYKYGTDKLVPQYDSVKNTLVLARTICINVALPTVLQVNFLDWIGCVVGMDGTRQIMRGGGGILEKEGP
jgi:hypothetical protein